MLARTCGRLILLCTWMLALLAITPHLSGGFMPGDFMPGDFTDGGFVSVWGVAYMLAGLAGAALLPVKDSPDPMAPPRPSA